MRKWLPWAIVGGVIFQIALTVFSFRAYGWFEEGIWLENLLGEGATIDIISYRLAEDNDGDDVIIVKYLLKNNSDETTSLYWEGDFFAYQRGVSLDQCYVDIKAYDYDADDSGRNVKPGVEYYAEIAYYLEYPDADVEIEVNDYGFGNNTKTKTFTLN